jgi:hypothetical protein
MSTCSKRPFLDSGHDPKNIAKATKDEGGRRREEGGMREEARRNEKG